MNMKEMAELLEKSKTYNDIDFWSWLESNGLLSRKGRLIFSFVSKKDV